MALNGLGQLGQQSGYYSYINTTGFCSCMHYEFLDWCYVIHRIISTFNRIREIVRAWASCGDFASKANQIRALPSGYSVTMLCS